jgi:CheY-like chemotaxis protein
MHTGKNDCGDVLAPPMDWSAMSVSDHVVQLYEAEAHLLDMVSGFTSAGLQAREAAVVIATGPHRQQLETRLSAQGIDLTRLRQQGQYVALDATDMLSWFMGDGCLDRWRFDDLMKGIMGRVGSRYAHVRMFGEMVALLWEEGNRDAALRLEEFWNDLATSYGFSLLCAYPMRAFSSLGDTGKFLTMCAAHSHVIPAESYTALASPGERLRAIVQLQQKAYALESEMAARQQRDLQGAAPVRPLAGRGQMILIVDDEPGIARALTFLLQRDGHTVETAANGHLALAKCQERDYDMILCDLHMPELDGLGFYQELQRQRSSLCQRVLFLTGDLLAPEVQAFLDQVALPHLHKPFTAAMIRKVILENMGKPDIV